MSEFNSFKPFKNWQNSRPSASYYAERAIRRTMFFEGWKGCNGESAESSIILYRTAARMATTKEWKYDCWVPDPDDDNCCIHLLINEDDLIKRFVNSKNVVQLSSWMEIGITEFCDLPMADKLYNLCETIDILEFFNLEEVPEGINKAKVKLQQKMTDDAFRVIPLDEMI